VVWNVYAGLIMFDCVW